MHPFTVYVADEGSSATQHLPARAILDVVWCSLITGETCPVRDLGTRDIVGIAIEDITGVTLVRIERHADPALTDNTQEALVRTLLGADIDDVLPVSTGSHPLFGCPHF